MNVTCAMIPEVVPCRIHPPLQIHTHPRVVGLGVSMSTVGFPVPAQELSVNVITPKAMKYRVKEGGKETPQPLNFYQVLTVPSAILRFYLTGN